jgi:hypothetical protein
MKSGESLHIVSRVFQPCCLRLRFHISIDMNGLGSRRANTDIRVRIRRQTQSYLTYWASGLTDELHIWTQTKLMTAWY